MGGPHAKVCGYEPLVRGRGLGGDGFGDGVDLLEDGGGEFREDVEGAEVFGELFDAGGAEND